MRINCYRIKSRNFLFVYNQRRPANIQIHITLWYNKGGSTLPYIKTTLAKDIEAENLDIRYDRSVNCVLGNVPLLAPITKYTVKELKDYSIPMVEQCIDADSIQINQVFVEPGLTNRKIVNDELENKIPGEGRVIFDIRFTITLPDGSKTKIIINIEPAEKQSRLQPPEPRHLLRSPAYLSPAFRRVYQRRLRQGAVRQNQESLQHLDLHGLPGGQEGLNHQLFL